MFVTGAVSVFLLVLLLSRMHRGRTLGRFSPRPLFRRRRSAGVAPVFLLVVTLISTLLAVNIAVAAIVPTIQLGTSANYSVLGGQTVTNTGPSVLANSVGVWPGTAITGFPPGQVLPPGIVDDGASATSQQAQSDLTVAYLDAAGRPLDATTTAELGGLTLVGGVYAGPSKSALTVTGTLTLDGEGNPNSVFIFQTDSTLTTATGSSVVLINGAQECNVFWQVGSSATLNGSVFVGNVLALTTITLGDGVTVAGRALAQNGEVTLINDTFTQPTCDLSAPVTTTTVGETTSTAAAVTTVPTTATTLAPELPFTGVNSMALLLVAMAAFGVGIILIRMTRTQA